MESFNFNFFVISGWVIDLDYCDIEWFALETNRDHSVVYETASKYCILDSFDDYEGYSMDLYILTVSLHLCIRNSPCTGIIRATAKSCGEGQGVLLMRS